MTHTAWHAATKMTRHHVEVHASQREKEWESPSASLIEKDPEVIPDVDIASQVGTDLFLDEKIPRHASGQGYVRVVEHSIMWKEKTHSKIFTYQGFTTCTEVDKSWTIMSSTYKRGKCYELYNPCFQRCSYKESRRYNVDSLLPQCRQRNDQILGQ
jgi:hypothetical protein